MAMTTKFALFNLNEGGFVKEDGTCAKEDKLDLLSGAIFTEETAKERGITLKEEDYLVIPMSRVTYDGLPDTDTLTPTRYWLVDDGVAEVEFSVAHSDDVTLRAAPTGTLNLPARYRDYEYESVGIFPVGDVDVTLSQSPGRESIFTWTQDGFDFAVFAPGAEMNVMGGISTEFVTGTSGKMKR